MFSVVIDSGPRYEVAYPNGICHFLEKLSFGVSIYYVVCFDKLFLYQEYNTNRCCVTFQATHKYATRDVMHRELERHGGICDCQGSRDTTVYATSADSRGLDAVTQVKTKTYLVYTYRIQYYFVQTNISIMERMTMVPYFMASLYKLKMPVKSNRKS